jgi:flagellar biosynthesis GTPase FlhF
MELKRILARDSRSANEKAIQLYGPEVLIISSQRVDQQTELIVAVDVRAESPVVSAIPTGAEPTLQAQGLAPAADQPVRANAADFVPFSKIFQSAHDFAPLEPEGAKAPAGVAPELALASVSSQAALQPSVQSPLQAFVPAQSASTTPELASAGLSPQVQSTLLAPAAYPVSAHEAQRSQEIVDMLRQEMAALRKEFSLSRQMMPWQDGLALSPDMQKLAMAMSEVGLPAGLRALLTDSIQSLQRTEEAWPVLQALLTDALARAAVPWPQAGVHALCGPSGSGKSSMVGRLALAAAQSQGAESQVMISFADQRPGAWAQMQLLAAQAGVSCFRAADVAMLQALLDDQWGKTVWIDTCGADFGSQALNLMNSLPKVSIHAVLPVDATVTSVQKILQNSPVSWASLMLTKVDEAAHPWPLIKGLSEQSLPVSCVAADSRILQAPVAFDAQVLVQMALRPLQVQLSNGQPVQALPLVKTVKPARRRSASPVAAQPAAVAAKRPSKARLAALSEVPAGVPVLATHRAAKASASLKAVHG